MKVMDSHEILAAFAHQQDGTWLCTAPALILTPDGPVETLPGQVFTYGERLGSLDVAEYLEQLGAQFGS